MRILVGPRQAPGGASSPHPYFHHHHHPPPLPTGQGVMGKGFILHKGSPGLQEVGEHLGGGRRWHLGPAMGASGSSESRGAQLTQGARHWGLEAGGAPGCPRAASGCSRCLSFSLFFFGAGWAVSPPRC